MTKKLCRISALVLSFNFFLVAVSLAAQDDSFESWLEKYGAWDRLEQEYAAVPSGDTPETILKRAQVYLNLNSPKQALEIIEMSTAFDDNATEAQRLFLGGKAHRALGDLSKSVLWFTQSAKFTQDNSRLRQNFRQEPEMETVWSDVWTKMYWSYLSNYTLSRDAQLDALNQILAVGRTVWDDDFWEKAAAVLNPAADNASRAAVLPAPAAPELGPDGLPLPPFISKSDTEAVVSSMALVSLEKFDEARVRIETIAQPPVREFWLKVINFLETGAEPGDITVFLDGNYLKAYAFWAGNVLAPYSASRASWLLGNPDSAPWKKFRNKLLSMPLADAHKAIDNELGSMLISEDTATLLHSFKLALSLSDGDFISSATTWNKIDKRKLPLALKLAAVLLFKEDLKNVLPLDPAESFMVYPTLCALTGAAGDDLNAKTEAPFWTVASKNNLKRLSTRDWPFDKLLLLAYWQESFAQKPTTALAKRSAFLFDGTSFGINSVLYLADSAVRSKNLQMGAFYLNRINADSLSAPQKMSWLDTKLRLELDAGKTDTALKTFKEMSSLDERIPVMTRLRLALLYQQRRDFDTAREQLLIMWKDRNKLPTALQAETLFWLGEGEQAVRNTDKALDYYLRLAWQYPQENIWALTAMYRASLIYERQGKYETAKRLLTTVVRRADRKEQREAAKARINAIDKKMGETDKNEESALVYPF
jgi:hypothetical protein